MIIEFIYDPPLVYLFRLYADAGKHPTRRPPLAAIPLLLGSGTAFTKTREICAFYTERMAPQLSHSIVLLLPTHTYGSR